MADGVMREAGVAVADADLIAVTTGPGSFTGIRVGLAAARGAAFAAGLPIFGVTSFAATAALVLDQASPFCLLVALDSRRADFFVQILDPAGQPLSKPSALLPDALPPAVESAVGSRPLVVAGDAALRAAELLPGRAETTVQASTGSLAIGAAKAALARWRQGERGAPPVPVYLRPPGVTLGANSPPERR